MGITLNRESRLLFIGDSITDCGRRECKEGIGGGYPRLVRDYLLAKDPESAPIVLNTGISGNRVTHLQERWQRDVIEPRSTPGRRAHDLSELAEQDEESDAIAQQPPTVAKPNWVEVDLTLPNAQGPETHAYHNMAVHLYMRKP